MAGEKHEKFEYDSIKNRLISLKENYTDYINAVNRIDLIINEELNVSSESAMFNPQGKNNIQFEGNSDNIVLDDTDLNIKPTTYSKEDLDNDNINYATGYEADINKKYQEYLDGVITEKDWKNYVDSLNTEQKNYAEIVSTGDLVVNTSDVESLLKDTLEPPKNMAEQVAEKNKVPEGWIYLDQLGTDKLQEDFYVDPFSVRMGLAEKFTVWANSVSPDADNNVFPISIEYENDIDLENGSYIRAIKGENGTDFELYRNGEYVRTLDVKGRFTGGNHDSDYTEIWNETFPNICYRNYTDEGYDAYKTFKNSINDNYEEFKITNKFYLNSDKNIYFSGDDGEIHYSDGSVLQIYEDDLKWNLNVLFLHFEGKDNSAIEDIFMIANGYVTYDLDYRCKGYGEQ